jgi:hypothetical protein
MALSKYLDKNAIELYMGALNIEPTFQPMSQDSYNERAVLKTILDTRRALELLYAAINMGCIGFGDKKYGNFKVNGKVVDIAVLLRECNVKLGIGKDAKLEEGDLTPGRLCRAFRYYIRDYVNEHDFETYLYRNYSDRNPKFRGVLFRGAEYLDDLSKDEIDAIIDAHQRLDLKRQTNITDRVNRIFAAKGTNKAPVV